MSPTGDDHGRQREIILDARDKIRRRAIKWIALRLAPASAFDLPVILVSGTIAEQSVAKARVCGI